jgi:hypothetical protein
MAHLAHLMAQPASPFCAGDFGNSTLQAEAAELFRTVQDANATLPPDLAAVVAQLAVQSGDSLAVYRVTNTFQKVLWPGQCHARVRCLLLASICEWCGFEGSACG